MQHSEGELKFRLKNCLETFLEFDFFLNQLQQNCLWNNKNFIQKEMDFIKEMLIKIDRIDFSLDDLKRIENYMKIFLKEMSSLTGKPKINITWTVEKNKLQ